jgi:hypothetical protein
LVKKIFEIEELGDGILHQLDEMQQKKHAELIKEKKQIGVHLYQLMKQDGDL